jgi:glycosyltransferase involved in cell wall biosynthesis
MRQHIPNVHYILAGKGDDRPRIEALVTQLNLQDCVTLPGFLTDEELCDHYNLCDMFAMPSQGEGFGIVFLEALACGKPVLAGNQDGSVQPLAGGELGCLVNPNNVDEIANKLIKILQGNYSNPTVYQSEYLRHRTIESFDLTQFKTKLAELLEAVSKEM